GAEQDASAGGKRQCFQDHERDFPETNTD
ncbi:MAG: hypothetical protein RI936_634, partial [Pseudomonadota bacterium]